jgi:hypothetical protein
MQRDGQRGNTHRGPPLQRQGRLLGHDSFLEIALLMPPKALVVRKQVSPCTLIQRGNEACVVDLWAFEVAYWLYFHGEPWGSGRKVSREYY